MFINKFKRFLKYHYHRFVPYSIAEFCFALLVDVVYAIVCLKQINKVKIYIFFQPITRIEKPASDFQLLCFGTSHSFQATLKNLSIDRDYVIQVTSVYSGSHASLCASAPENCTSAYQLFLKGKAVKTKLYLEIFYDVAFRYSTVMVK